MSSRTSKRQGKETWTIYGKLGHLTRACPHRKYGDEHNNYKKYKKNRTIQDNELETVVIKAYIVGEEVNWWIDTGATRLIYEKKDLFTSYELASERWYEHEFSSFEVIMKDIVKLRFNTKKTVTLSEVLHVLDIRKNHISWSLLIKLGFKIMFEFDKVILTKYDTTTKMVLNKILYTVFLQKCRNGVDDVNNV